MRALIFIALVAAVAYFAHRHHQNSVEEAAKVARASAIHEGEEKARREAEEKSKKYVPVAVSQIIEPMYVELFGDISSNNPVDLVPQLEITRERITDKRPNPVPAREVIYSDLRALMTSMIALAEERTKATESLLRAQTAKSSALDTAGSSSANPFFVEGVMRKWRDERARRKPAIEAQFAKLRQSEREWNRNAPEKAKPDTYDLPSLPRLLVSLETPAASTTPTRPQGVSRVIPGWRRSYYDRYGYPSPYYPQSPY